MTLYIHRHVRNRLGKISNRSDLIHFINTLASNPETLGDYRQPDPRRRMIEVSILGRQAILFFKDPYAGLVKVLDIQNVETL